MKIIYEPKGKAFEYAPLSANLYRGCTHACKYCYAPDIMRMSREEFNVLGHPRKDVLKILEKDAIELAGDPRPVLLCFTSDLYQPSEEKHRITRGALQILGNAQIKTKVLTKNGILAQRDIDLFDRYKVEVGVTMLFMSNELKKEWEPEAGDLPDRLALLKACHDRGIRTWISIEPVIHPEEALSVIRYLADSGTVDMFKIGKLNHFPDIEAKVDWPDFLHKALGIITKTKAAYYIKNDLWALAGPATRETFSKSKEALL